MSDAYDSKYKEIETYAEQKNLFGLLEVIAKLLLRIARNTEEKWEY